MADITVGYSSSTVGFTPSTYPATGGVTQGSTVTFIAAGTTAATFYAQAGLFYVPGSGTKVNDGNTAFSAPASGGTPLSLTVAANPGSLTGYTLSINPITDVLTTPSDGTINVTTKPAEWSEPVMDPSGPAPRRPAPAPAMQARGSD